MANVGDRYIIEIAEIYASSYRNAALTEDQIKAPTYLYRIKGFSSLVFDENGLSKLEKYEESPFTQEDCDRARREGYDEGYSKAENDYYQQTETDRESIWQFGYEQGLNDAWEAARKIANMDSMIQKTIFEVYNCYPSKQIADVFENYSADEAISKIKAYEEQKKAEEEIKVGDEITWEYKGENNRAVITYICDHYWDVICEDGRNYAVGIDTRKKCTKTGRHFDIEGILKVMREE